MTGQCTKLIIKDTKAIAKFVFKLLCLFTVMALLILPLILSIGHDGEFNFEPLWLLLYPGFGIVVWVVSLWWRCEP